MSFDAVILAIEQERATAADHVSKCDQAIAALRAIDDPAAHLTARAKVITQTRAKARTPAATPKTLAGVVHTPAPSRAAEIRAAVLKVLHHAATTFVEDRPEGVEGMDAIALRAAVAVELGVSRKAALESEWKTSMANACQLLKRDGEVWRTTGGWWALTEKAGAEARA